MHCILGPVHPVLAAISLPRNSTFSLTWEVIVVNKINYLNVAFISYKLKLKINYLNVAFISYKLN